MPEDFGYYEIEITHYRKVRKEVKEYERLHDKSAFDNKIEPQYGYVATGQEVIEENKVYRQTVDNLDLSKVILAVNGIKKKECSE